MRGLRPKVHLLLAAFLLASTVSVAAHYSAHANANAEQCLLCVSNASPNTATASPNHDFAFGQMPEQLPSPANCSAPAIGYRIFSQSRGPPSTS
jgi:hypothetical protein